MYYYDYYYIFLRIHNNNVIHEINTYHLLSYYFEFHAQTWTEPGNSCNNNADGVYANGSNGFPRIRIPRAPISILVSLTTYQHETVLAPGLIIRRFSSAGRPQNQSRYLRVLSGGNTRTAVAVSRCGFNNKPRDRLNGQRFILAVCLAWWRLFETNRLYQKTPAVLAYRK